ncbi:hypothetical protein [Rhodococcus sp. IEGM 1379]|uniref:hypothetical protein n=1 Tax=Rhodococcus sp. IEGM 1379 TaxID=3047086 RepID=UPI0024B6450C|nr:hypothetical protein [Rhodococcus sp. IEGM 1379]MDI9914358.1 hypothetical protein [Rhodococcus sp. IEGM 1379]
MGIFNRDRSISGMQLDGNLAIQAHLGEMLVWDGTRAAFVSVPCARVSTTVVVPAVSAGAVSSVSKSVGSVAVVVPVLTASSVVRPETTVIVTARATDPSVRGDSTIMAEVITVAGQTLPAVAAQSFSASVVALAAPSGAVVRIPVVAAAFSAVVAATVVNAMPVVPVITATGTAVLNSPVAAVNVAARVPVVSGSSRVTVLAVTGEVATAVPVVSASSAVAAVKAVVTALAPVPVVTGASFAVAGMTKNGSQTTTAGASGARKDVTGWTADSGSTVTSNALIVSGPKTSATISGQIRLTTAYPTSTIITPYLTVNGTLVKTGTAVTVYGETKNVPVSVTYTVSAGDAVKLQYSNIDSDSGIPAAGDTIVAGVSTFLRVT